MRENITPIAQRLVDLIENEAEDLAKEWLNNVSENVDLPSYHHFDKGELYNTAFEVYRHIGKWVAWETSREEVAEQYMAHGAQRRQQKFELAEVVQALILMRVYLWRKALSGGLLVSAYELQQAIELNLQVVRYFDRAIYFTIIGYMKNGNI
jgi:hypothetical protein